MSEAHENPAATPSPWVRRFAPLIPAGGDVLDLACGSGRHARLLGELGYHVEAVDRDPEALAALRGVAGVTVREADLENGPWPYHSRAFDGIVVSNYLWRPLLPSLLNTLGEGGVLIYETFMSGNELLGKPSNPKYLLRPGELLELMTRRHFTVIAFEQGEVESPRPAVIQRVCARRGRPVGLPPA
ncbi:MAG: class I SAM-dependent methyltransferase [Gammaproteobacteria bacterium]|nr:class I SAM-dependent methyltransferase [Gammaproteobacteria bacterium]MBU1645444.1 class I SAM-dependent methyltransferase [Gammaproteobacteria bacterium]MBU1971067.1 class I SAM-dependent methyltransferase [Gammaproteobacteria bacterium]